jgi:hypothetical protein
MSDSALRGTSASSAVYIDCERREIFRSPK